MYQSIENFNRIVNRSVCNQDALWKDYRISITSILKSNIKFSDSIIILGAGMCYDFDLNSLLQSCKHITLVDVDEEALISGLERNGITNVDNSIKLMATDVTGLENKDFMNKLFRLLISNSTINEVESFLKDHLSEKNIPDKFKNVLEHYDVVITMPIYTQLLFTQITSMLKGLEIRRHVSSDFVKNIQEVVLKFIPKLINNYNTLLRSLCHKSGIIIAFSDLIETYPEHEVMIKIKGMLMNNTAMNSFLSDYIDQYGYGLGTYGIMDLKESINVIKQHYLIWPFTETRELLVNGIVGNIKV